MQSDIQCRHETTSCKVDHKPQRRARAKYKLLGNHPRQSPRRGLYQDPRPIQVKCCLAKPRHFRIDWHTDTESMGEDFITRYYHTWAEALEEFIRCAEWYRDVAGRYDIYGDGYEVTYGVDEVTGTAYFRKESPEWASRHELYELILGRTSTT